MARGIDPSIYGSPGGVGITQTAIHRDILRRRSVVDSNFSKLLHPPFEPIVTEFDFLVAHRFAVHPGDIRNLLRPVDGWETMLLPEFVRVVQHEPANIVHVLHVAEVGRVLVALPRQALQLAGRVVLLGTPLGDQALLRLHRYPKLPHVALPDSAARRAAGPGRALPQPRLPPVFQPMLHELGHGVSVGEVVPPHADLGRCRGFWVSAASARPLLDPELPLVLGRVEPVGGPFGGPAGPACCRSCRRRRRPWCGRRRRRCGCRWLGRWCGTRVLHRRRPFRREASRVGALGLAVADLQPGEVLGRDGQTCSLELRDCRQAGVDQLQGGGELRGGVDRVLQHHILLVGLDKAEAQRQENALDPIHSGECLADPPVPQWDATKAHLPGPPEDVLHDPTEDRKRALQLNRTADVLVQQV
mmetsp:Transcript_27916/g.67841  ORF Transcript_27916/g.67841 Transcript_27916/m.67841 type:complete len:416 (+) Transcript_27916:430-1677(+)